MGVVGAGVQEEEGGGRGGAQTRSRLIRSPLDTRPVSVADWRVERRVEAEMLVAVMCVGRNAPVLSTQAELCKKGSVETFAWYSVSGLSLLAHGLNTHAGPCAHAHAHTHTLKSCTEDLLIARSEGEALRREEG